MEHALHLAAGAFLQDIYPNAHFRKTLGNAELGDENDDDWINAMQSKGTEGEKEEMDEVEDFEPGDLLGKILALINQVCIFALIHHLTHICRYSFLLRPSLTLRLSARRKALLHYNS